MQWCNCRVGLNSILLDQSNYSIHAQYENSTIMRSLDHGHLRLSFVLPSGTWSQSRHSVTCMTILCLQITRSDIWPHVMWVLSLVITDGRFNYLSGLCWYVWVDMLYRPRRCNWSVHDLAIEPTSLSQLRPWYKVTICAKTINYDRYKNWHSALTQNDHRSYGRAARTGFSSQPPESQRR